MALNKVLSTPKFWMVERGATGRVAPSPKTHGAGLEISCCTRQQWIRHQRVISRMSMSQNSDPPSGWFILYVICFILYDDFQSFALLKMTCWCPNMGMICRYAQICFTARISSYLRCHTCICEPNCSRRASEIYFRKSFTYPPLKFQWPRGSLCCS